MSPMTCQASMEVDKECDDLVREKGGPGSDERKGKIYVHEEGTRLGAPMRCSAPIRAWHALTPYTSGGNSEWGAGVRVQEHSLELAEYE